MAEYKGSIVSKKLEYAGITKPLPVAGVPKGSRGKLHVVGRNDMSTSQNIGVYWFVADPEGFIAEEYTDWKWGTLGPGQTHEFISSGQFDLNKLGKYTTWIKLFMGSEDNPDIMVWYIGEVCTVVSLLEPTFSELAVASFSKV